MKPTPKISAQVAAWLIIINGSISLVRTIEVGIQFALGKAWGALIQFIGLGLVIPAVTSLFYIFFGYMILKRKNWAHTTVMAITVLAFAAGIILPIATQIRRFNLSELSISLILFTFLWLSKDEFKKKV